MKTETMTSLLYFFVIVTIQIVDATNFEYDAETIKGVASKSKAKTLLFDFINPATKVVFRRTSSKTGPNNEEGYSFQVDTKWDGQNLRKYTLLQQLPTSSLIQFPSDLNDPCDWRPGIRASLKQDYFVNWGSTTPQTNYKLFCLDEMQIDISKNREGRPFMTLTAYFSDKENKQNIGIIVNPFKPSTKEVNNKQARENHVPIIDFPAPFQAVVTDKDGSQMLIGDITWMTDVLKLAKIIRSDTDAASGKYTEYYSAGPVIFQASSFQKILDLGFANN